MRMIRASHIVVGAALVALLTSAAAWSAVAYGQEAKVGKQVSPSCTLAGVHGTYGDQLSGLALKPDGTVGVTFSETGVEFFDGAGHTRGTFTAQNSVLGSIDGTYEGTYTVQADCTGSKDLIITITQHAGPPVPAVQAHYDFVLVDGGRQLLLHGTAAGLNTVEHGQLVRQ